MDVSLGQEIPTWKAAALLRIPLAGRPVLTGQTGICWKKKRMETEQAGERNERSGSSETFGRKRGRGKR